MTIRVEPNSRGVPAVGVIEEVPGGAGPQKKAAFWMAAITASETLGIPLTAHEFQMIVRGFVDGPSAGMLKTATLLALMTGKPIRGDTTMTGTINPDGTAGPVSGIPQKLQGAKGKGKTRFGYPIGKRQAKDMKTGKLVDMQAFARDEGVEAREIKDLWEAYEFLTGATLPRPKPVDESDMELAEDDRARLVAKIAGYKADLGANIGALKQQLSALPKGVQKAVAGSLESLKSYDATARRYERSGMIVPAYTYYGRALVMMNMVSRQLEFVGHLLKGNNGAMLAMVESAKASSGRLDSLMAELILDARKTTVGGQINTVAALVRAVKAICYEDKAAQALRDASKVIRLIREGKLKVTRDSLFLYYDRLSRPLSLFAAVDALVRGARDGMSLAAEEGRKTEIDLKRMGGPSRAYGSAAHAGLEYLDSMITKDVAAAFKVSMAEAKTRLGTLEPSSALARTAAAVAVVLPRRFGSDKPESHVVRLAAGAWAYLTSAALVNKWYSLKTRFKKGGGVDIRQRRVLTYQLDLARLRAREAAARCKAELGFIPTAARRAYQLATAFREATDEDKLAALEEYWTATLWSSLAVMLSRPVD